MSSTTSDGTEGGRDPFRLVHGGVYRAGFTREQLVARRFPSGGWCLYSTPRLNEERVPEYAVCPDGTIASYVGREVRYHRPDLELVWVYPAGYPFPERHKPDVLPPL